MCKLPVPYYSSPSICAGRGLRKGIIRFLTSLYSLKVSLQFFGMIQMVADNSDNVTNKCTLNSSCTSQSISTAHQRWPQQVLMPLKLWIYPAKKEPLGGAARLGTGPSSWSLAGIELRSARAEIPAEAARLKGLSSVCGTGNSGLPSSGWKLSPFCLHGALSSKRLQNLFFPLRAH